MEKEATGWEKWEILKVGRFVWFVGLKLHGCSKTTSAGPESVNWTSDAITTAIVAVAPLCRINT